MQEAAVVFVSDPHARIIYFKRLLTFEIELIPTFTDMIYSNHIVERKEYKSNVCQ